MRTSLCQAAGAAQCSMLHSWILLTLLVLCVTARCAGRR